MTKAARNPALLLDEMFSPVIAEALRRRGHDVICVAEHPQLRAMSDPDLHEWASQHGRRIVTENVADFLPLLRRAQAEGKAAAPLLLSSSRTFVRSRRDPGPLIEAIDSWLGQPDCRRRPAEDWLRPAPAESS